MDLDILTSGTPNTKPWNNWVGSTVSANNVISTGGTFGTVTAGNIVGPISTGVIVLTESKTPSSPPAGEIKVYADLITGAIDTVNSSGNVTSLIQDNGVIPMQAPLILYGGVTAMGAQYSMTPANGPIVSNTVTESTLLGGVGDYIGSPVINLGTFFQGRVLKFVTTMFVSTSITSSTLVLNIKIDNANLISTTVATGALTNNRFRWEVEVLNSNGVSCEADGVLFQDAKTPVLTEGALMGFDPTVNHTIGLTATWNTASTSNQVQCNTFYVSRLF